MKTCRHSGIGGRNARIVAVHERRPSGGPNWPLEKKRRLPSRGQATFKKLVSAPPESGRRDAKDVGRCRGRSHRPLPRPPRKR
ncbi:hypothetical protein MTO96_022899 [Rhipicephalus appendiculatus]